jgi:hypothetical protein
MFGVDLYYGLYCYDFNIVPTCGHVLSYADHCEVWQVAEDSYAEVLPPDLQA